MLFLIIFVSAVTVFIGQRSPALLQGADFPHFYCAARMLADGHGHELYDADVQREYQARYTGRIGTLYSHPPFEAVLYLAVAWLPLKSAYLLWSMFNISLVAVSAWRMAREALLPWNWRVMLMAALSFVPALVSVLQGQDSLLLLLLVVLAFTALRRGHAFAAGCWFGLGLFKFQLVLPLVLMLVSTQGRGARSPLAKGFSLITLALAGLSVALSGWSVLTLYPRFLLHFPEQPFAGFAPRAMANFRGLAYFFFHRDRSPWAITAVSILSAAALIMTLTDWRHEPAATQPPASRIEGEFDLAFANTVLFALLVSYHLNPHDVSLLLLPIPLLLHPMLAYTPRRLRPAHWMTLGLSAILFLPPLHLWGLRAGAYALVAIPILLLFLISGSLLRQSKTPHITLHIHKDQGEN
jgi:hypothetical protein